MLDFADEMGVGSIVLLDEPSEDDLVRLADSAMTVVLPMAGRRWPTGASAAPAA